MYQALPKYTPLRCELCTIEKEDPKRLVARAAPGVEHQRNWSSQMSLHGNSKVAPGVAALERDRAKARPAQQHLAISLSGEKPAALSVIEQACALLADAKTITDARRVIAMAEVGGDIARQQARLAEDAQAAKRASQAAIEADGLRLEAEAVAGVILKQMRDSGERAKGGEHLNSQESLPATLADLGVSRDESSRWQRVAAVPFEKRKEYIDQVLKNGGDVSRASLLRLITATPRRQAKPARTQRTTTTSSPSKETPTWEDFERVNRFWLDKDETRCLKWISYYTGTKL